MPERLALHAADRQGTDRCRAKSADIARDASTALSPSVAKHQDPRQAVQVTGGPIPVAAGVVPACVEAECLDRFAVRQAQQPLQHHHRCHDPWGHAAPADLGDRSANSSSANSRSPSRYSSAKSTGTDAAPAQRCRAAPEVALPGGHTGRHPPSRTKNHIDVILPDPGSTGELARPQETPAT